MTDSEIAIERLTTWVREFGDSKSKVFVNDVRMLLNIVKSDESEKYKKAIDWLVDEIYSGVINARELNEISDSDHERSSSTAKLKAWSQAYSLASKAKEMVNKSSDSSEKDAIDSTQQWTDERCDQLERFSKLLEIIRMADKGSSFIRSFQKAEDIANGLGGDVISNKTFIEFLKDLAIKSRQNDRL